VWHITPTEKGLQRKRLGRYLGPALNHVDAMCGFVLRETGKVVDRSSIIPLSDEELRSESIKEMQAKFTANSEFQGLESCLVQSLVSIPQTID
jgi:hypothetical protein